MATPKRLVLINPALTAEGARLPNVAGVTTMEPLGLAYVAGLTPRDWQVTLLDEVAAGRPIDPAGLQADLVGITTLTATAPRAYALASALRQRGIPVVLGGPHPTLASDEAAGYADVVFRGEAEGAWPALIADFEGGHLQPRYEGGGPTSIGTVRPRRDLYRHRYALTLISASRGCRYRCEFCAVWKMAGGDLRFRPVADVWDELATTPKGWATLFTDDNIIADRTWALELFRGMAQHGLRRRFAVQASLSIADDRELLVWLRRAGCFAVMTGLESVSEASLAGMRKGVNLRVGVAHYAEKIAQIHAAGLMVAGTFIFGNDGDERDVFQRTVEVVLSAGLDLAHFGLLVPDPGTDLFARLQREGRLLYTDYPADYARHHLGQALFTPAAMSPAELEVGMRRAVAAVSGWPVLVRRAWRTWRATGNPFAALVAMAWTRTGLRARATT